MSKIKASQSKELRRSTQSSNEKIKGSRARSTVGASSTGASSIVMQTHYTLLFRRVQEAGFILLTAIAIFLFVSLISYHEADPGWSHTAAEQAIHNIAGHTGAWFSDLFLFLFGFIAYLFPLIILVAGFQLLQKREKITLFNRLLWILRVLGFVSALLSGCGLAELHFSSVTEYSFGAGGILGNIVDIQLVPACGLLGSSLLLIAFFLTGITLATGLSWFGLMDRIGLGLIHFVQKVRENWRQYWHAMKICHEKCGKFQQWSGSILERFLFNPIEHFLSRKKRRSNTSHDNFNDDFTDKYNVNFHGSNINDPNESFNAHFEDEFEQNSKSNESDDFNESSPFKNAFKNPFKNNSAKNKQKIMPILSLDKSIVPVDHSRERQRPPIISLSDSTFESDQKNQQKTMPTFVQGLKPSEHDADFSVRVQYIQLPSVDLLEKAKPAKHGLQFSSSKLASLSREVEARLLEFGLQVHVVAVLPGPVITRFELELAAGTKVSKISGLSKDLARALSVTRVRVVEVIPGKSVIGLEIPNEHRELVCFREIIESSQYQDSDSPLTLALGKDISGEPVAVNLAKMPHLLVAGTTGSGKSVGVNAMLLSILFKATPMEVRLILIDPKMLELSIYDGIPHLLTPVVTDMKDAANALKWCVAEMDRRYQVMAACGVRNLSGYNAKVIEAENQNKPLVNPLWRPEMGGEPPLLERLPYVVVIIDEFADMIMVVGKKVEELIARIAQKARAAGIHMILATQRPSVDVITGLIKANVPTRIAFQVSSRIDSRTILDQQGAEQLLGHGDMLYLAPGAGIPIRVHGAFVSDEEVHTVVKALKSKGEPDYAHDILGSQGFAGLDTGRGSGKYSAGSGKGSQGLGMGGFGIGTGFGDSSGLGLDDGEQDDLYDQAVQIVIESRRASISHLQRRLKIGYNRAARLIETMEAAGVVSAMQSNGGREVLSRDIEAD